MLDDALAKDSRSRSFEVAFFPNFPAGLLIPAPFFAAIYTSPKR